MKINISVQFVLYVNEGREKRLYTSQFQHEELTVA